MNELGLVLLQLLSLILPQPGMLRVFSSGLSLSGALEGLCAEGFESRKNVLVCQANN